MKLKIHVLIISTISLLLGVVLINMARHPVGKDSNGRAKPNLTNPAQVAPKIESESQEKHLLVKERTAAPGDSPIDRMATDQSLHTLLSKRFPPPSSEVSSGNWDKAIQQVLSESWLDPEEKTVRRRIRVVETDFKYSHLRLEEEVCWNDGNSRFESTLRAASVADHLMVMPAPGRDVNVVMDHLTNEGFRVRSESSGLILLEIPDSNDAVAQLDVIEKLESLDEFVDFAEPDYLVFSCAAPNDPMYSSGQQWSLENKVDSIESKSDADIDAELGWGVRTSAANITVAVLDTGVRYTHEDLVNRMWQDGVGNPGWDAYDDDDDPMDVDGHGTHCAGIIGAQGNNGVGIAGVAWDVDIMAVRFIGQLGGTTSDAIRAMNYARMNGANIISASWGGSGYSRGLLAAITACYNAGIPVVTAAGNERWDVDAKPQYPASYQTPNIVSVAATTRNDTLTTFSNYGYTAIDLAAPGENILSCGIASNSDYRYLSGTSAATPHVAGALALAKAQFGPELVDDLVIRLLRSVDRIPALQDKVATEGRLNLHQLLLSSSTGYDHDFFNTPYVFKYCDGYWCHLNHSLTREPDEDTYSPGTGNRSAWFQWTAHGDGLMRFTGSMSQEDVSVVAFEGTIRNQLRRIKDNFSERPVASSDLHFYVKKDQTYTFSVDSRSSVNQIIAASFSFRPGNDMVSQAVVIPTSKSFNVSGTNCSATIEPFEYALPHQNLVQQASVWWRWTPSESGEYVVSTLGSNFDTVLAVYQRNGSTFQTVGVNDSRSLTDDTSRLEFALTGGQEYYIVVASYHKDTVGDIELSGFPKKEIRFLQQPASQLVRLGDSFQLGVITDTTSEATYEWYGPQGQLGGVGNQSRITIPAAGANDMGGYYVLVRDGEASGQSATATISELALPPRFLFSPQDISVLSGTDIQMFAKADGLQPVTLRWFKNGVEVQTGHLHTIANSSPPDSGIYHVEASNAIGTTKSHPFQVMVSTDTVGPLIYRSPGIPSASLIKFVNGRHMGFGNDGRLILSANGINWENPTIPESMDIHDIDYDATLGLYVIVGENRNNSLVASAVSLNGRNWTKNPAPLPDWAPLEKVVAGNGIFVGYSTWLANKVYTTTNGVDWTPQDYTATAGSETWKQLQNIVHYNGEFIGGGRGTIFRSSNGINWTTNTTPNDGRILVWNGKLATFTGSPVGFSTSTDGINWTAPVQCVTPPSDLTRITSNGTRFYHAVSSTVASSPDGINWHQVEYEIKPTNPYSTTANFAAVSGPEGNLVALGGGGIVQGPSYTQLVSPNPDDVFTLPPITKIFGNTVYQLDDTTTTVVYSNDLRTWHSNNISGRFQFEGDSLIKAKGKFWALGRPYLAGQQTLLSGSSPIELTAHPQGTFNTTIKYLRTWNDDIYAVNDDQVLKLDLNSNWQVVYIMPKILNAIEKVRGLKTINRGMMIWSDYGAVYTSLNGTTWVRAQSSEPAYIVADSEHPTTKPRYAGPSFCEFDGKAYIYTSVTNKLYVASTGFNFSTQLNLNPLSRLTAVPEGLLGIEGTTGWYSPDGTTWQQFPIHYLTDFFHHYNGTLLAYSQNGLYQAGSPSSLAPTNSVANLVEFQSVISGSLFDLEYSVLDPEDRFNRVEFYLNGVLAGQSTNTNGLTSLNVTGGGERVIEMRSFDQDGQVTSDFWTLFALTSAPDMVLYAPSISSGSISYSVWNNRLQAGIGDELFSKIGDDWFGRTMPFTTSNTKFVFSPDEVFAVGPSIGSNQNVLMSEDGIRWNGLNYYVDSMKYQDGRLLAKLIRHRTGGQFSNLGISSDGITWNKSSTGNLGSAAGNGVVVGVYGAGFGLSTIKTSNDGGATWAARASLEIYNIQFESGYFHGIGKTTYYRSTDGITWTNLSPSLVAGEEIKYLDIAGGWHYLITGGFNVSYMWMSQDNGTTWTKLTNSPFPFSRVYYASGIWFANRANGIYASNDGLNWSLSIPSGGTQQANFPYVTSGLILNFYGHEGGATLPTTNGLWTTQDGFNWEKETTPQTASAPPLLEEPMTINASTKSAYLQAKAFISANGTNWFQSPFVPASGHSIRHVQMFNNKLLIYSGANNQAHQLWESSDGINFSQVALNGSYFFNTVKKNGSRMFAKGNIVGGASNQFFTSSDGANWTQLTTPGNFTSTIELLNGTLVIIDPRVAGNPGYQNVHHSADGASWQTTTLGSNANISGMTYGNGFFLANHSGSMWKGATIAGLALVPSNANGTIAFANGSFYLKTTSGISTSTDGASWQQIYSNLTGNLDAIGDTIYLNDTASLRPLIAADLQVTAVTGTPGNLAVGANINATVSLRNVGNASVPAGTNISVRGVLTRDRLFGNEDDVFAGIDLVALGSELAVNASTDLNVSFRVPGLRAGGQFKLVLTIDPETPELSSTNNTDMTEGTLLTVNEFVLNIVRNGNGNVGRDVSALRYANGTLVTLGANAAKGSGFGGWTGANVSPLSQITVMMNQDQNLTANFLATATLRLSIVGLGNVVGWEDPGSYLIGSTASLTAQPTSGWEFARWAGGSNSTNASIDLTVTQNTNLTAIFRQTLNGWKGRHFSLAELEDPSISGDLVDTDLDEIPNWQEYLHGSNPKDSRSKGLVQKGLDGGFLQFIYTRNTGAEAPYSIACEGSLNMLDWNAPDFEQRILSVNNGIETIEARMPANDSVNFKGFIRIKYEKP